MNEEEKKKEEKKNYRVLPSYENGTLEEWEAFNPYSPTGLKERGRGRGFL
jgi:hypothetical protein